MKNFYPKSKGKGKGKVHPSGADSTSPAPVLSALSLLPATILALVAVLNSEEKEALAYMLLWSMRPPTDDLDEKRPCKKPSTAGRPLFDCDCFSCYTSYWLRWNSSPHHHLIDQAIDTFEEGLSNAESTSPSAKKGRKKDRRGVERSARKAKTQPAPTPVESVDLNPNQDAAFSTEELAGDMPATKLALDEDGEEKEVEKSEQPPSSGEESVAVAGTRSSSSAACGRVLGRKMWPDMMGMFNSRMWGLWNPTV